MVGLGECFFAPFAIFLLATNFQLGLLGTLPQIMGSFLQLFSDKMLRLFHFRRQRLVCTGAFLQGFLCIPIALTFFLGTYRIEYLILFVVLYNIFGSTLGPVWNSWMGDLVNENHRGAYFGKRNRILGISSFISVLAGGYILKSFTDGTTRQYLGFVTLFVLAFLGRMVSTLYLSKKYEPEYKPAPEKKGAFWDFLKHVASDNFGIFVLCMCSMNFAVFMSAPFFAPYMLKDLKLDYMTYTMISATATITKLIVVPRWGRACDQFGCRKVLMLAGFLMPMCPILWLFCSQNWYLLLIQVYAGFVWAGFEMAVINLMFEATTPELRVSYLSYFNVLNSIAIFAGGMAGSFLVRYNHFFWSQYLFIFALSGLLRYIAYFTYIPRFKEVRAVDPIPYSRLLLKIMGILPVWELIHHGKKV
jgi:MFS family permease